MKVSPILGSHVQGLVLICILYTAWQRGIFAAIFAPVHDGNMSKRFSVLECALQTSSCKYTKVPARANIVSSLGISSEVVGDKSNVLFCFFCQKRIEGLFSLRKFFSSFPAIDVKKLLK